MTLLNRMHVAFVAVLVVAVLGFVVVANLLLHPAAKQRVRENAPIGDSPVSRRPAAATTPSVGGGPVADPAWVARTAAAAGIPVTAMAAYGNATLRLARDQPSCHLGWTTLAAIGTVESVNGTIDGRRLGDDGYSSRPITGPALNGVGGAAAIRDGDDWARALGPMQFLESTWRRWGTDADGDGAADVDNVFDAALAAARYLCADGADLRTGAAWTAAVRSYNHSDDYVRAVYDNANRFAAATA